VDRPIQPEAAGGQDPSESRSDHPGVDQGGEGQRQVQIGRRPTWEGRFEADERRGRFFREAAVHEGGSNSVGGGPCAAAGQALDPDPGVPRTGHDQDLDQPFLDLSPHAHAHERTPMTLRGEEGRTIPTPTDILGMKPAAVVPLLRPERPTRTVRGMAASREQVAFAAFLTGSVLAGGNAVGVRFSNRELPPLWGAGLRFGLAAVLLLAIMVVMRQGLPRGRALTGAMLYGLFNFAGSFALAYYALVRVHAGFGQILLAIVPLATLLLAVLWRQEHIRVAAVLGTLLALAGIAWMSRPTLGESVPLLSLLALLGGALCFAQAAVLVRRFPPVHPVTMNAVGMTTGAALLLAGSLFVGEAVALPERTATWVALGYLVAVGSVLVFVLYVVVLRYWAASRAAYTFVLIPVFTVALSAWLDNEPVGAELVIGGLLVIAGVYIGALRPAYAPVTPAEIAPPPVEPQESPPRNVEGGSIPRRRSV
jgi:drug/metabolite transporter (DMT)-like permease